MSGSDSAKPAVAQSRTRAAIKSYLHPRTAAMLVLGCSCGLPLLPISNTFGSLADATTRCSMTDIGLFAYTLLPYSLKFVWAPILDQVRCPSLIASGQAPGWMLVSQLGILVRFVGLWLSDPRNRNWSKWRCLRLLLVASPAASQDISVDAWRIEVAPAEEQGTMLGAYQLGYRVDRAGDASAAPYLAQHDVLARGIDLSAAA